MTTYKTPAGWRQQWDGSDPYPQVHVSRYHNGRTTPWPDSIVGAQAVALNGQTPATGANQLVLPVNDQLMLSWYFLDNSVTSVRIGYTGTAPTLQVQYHPKFDGGTEVFTGGGPVYTPDSPTIRSNNFGWAGGLGTDVRDYDVIPAFNSNLTGFACVGLKNIGSASATITNIYVYTFQEFGVNPTPGSGAVGGGQPPVRFSCDPFRYSSPNTKAAVMDFADVAPGSSEDRHFVLTALRAVPTLKISVVAALGNEAPSALTPIARQFLVSADGETFSDSVTLSNLHTSWGYGFAIRRVTPSSFTDAGPYTFWLRIDPFNNDAGPAHFVPFTYNVLTTGTAQPVPHLWSADPSEVFAGGPVTISGHGLSPSLSPAIAIRGRSQLGGSVLTTTDWERVDDDAVTHPAAEDLEHYEITATIDPTLIPTPGDPVRGHVAAVSQAAAVPTTTYHDQIAALKPFWWFRFGDTAGATSLVNTATAAYGMTFNAGSFNSHADLTGNLGTSAYAVGVTDQPGSNTGIASGYMQTTPTGKETKWSGYWVCGVLMMPLSADALSGYKFIWYHSGAFEVFLFEGRLAATLHTARGQDYTLVSQTAPLCDGSAHHFAVSYDGIRIRLFVDGSVVAWCFANGQINVSGNGPDQYGLTQIQLAHRDDTTSFAGGYLQEIAVGEGMFYQFLSQSPAILDGATVRSLYQKAFNTTSQPSNRLPLQLDPPIITDSAPDPATLSTTIERGVQVYSPTGAAETPLPQRYAAYQREPVFYVNGQPRKLPDLVCTARSVATLTEASLLVTDELSHALDVDLGADARWLADPATVVAKPTIGGDVTHWQPSQGAGFNWQMHQATAPYLDLAYQYDARNGDREAPAMVFDGSGWAQLVKPDGSSPGSTASFTFALVAQIKGSHTSRFHDLIAAPSADNANPLRNQNATLRADLDELKIHVDTEMIHERMRLFGASHKHKLLQYRPSIFVWCFGQSFVRLAILDARGYRHVEVNAGKSWSLFGGVFGFTGWPTIVNKSFYLGRAGSTPDLTYAAHMDVVDLAFWGAHSMKVENMHKVVKKLDGVWGVHK